MNPDFSPDNHNAATAMRAVIDRQDAELKLKALEGNIERAIANIDARLPPAYRLQGTFSGLKPLARTASEREASGALVELLNIYVEALTQLKSTLKK